MEKAKSAIEAAREYGVDIEQLRADVEADPDSTFALYAIGGSICRKGAPSHSKPKGAQAT